MKKLVCICMAALMTLFTLAGCSNEETVSSDNADGTSTGKVVVNFEGMVTAIDGDKITLENGQIIVVSSDTIFAGDPDTNNTVSEEMIVGNFIQGYTDDDPDSQQASADKIYCNTAVRTSGKMVMNFDGKVAAVENDRITLDNGQVILITNDTVFSIASGIVEKAILSVGYNIQGYTKDDPTASEVTASRIHIIAY